MKAWFLSDATRMATRRILAAARRTPRLGYIRHGSLFTANAATGLTFPSKTV
jgi:hypothetical protein